MVPKARMDSRLGAGFRMQGSGFRVEGSGFGVQGSGFKVQDSGFRVQGSGFSVWGLGSICKSQGRPEAGTFCDVYTFQYGAGWDDFISSVLIWWSFFCLLVALAQGYRDSPAALPWLHRHLLRLRSERYQP